MFQAKDTISGTNIPVGVYSHRRMMEMKKVLFNQKQHKKSTVKYLAFERIDQIFVRKTLGSRQTALESILYERKPLAFSSQVFEWILINPLQHFYIEHRQNSFAKGKKKNKVL